jgi:16S rRNA (guanine966-N2)-methyltransferase
LRPTPDRVRETLFNWLAPFIDGARCLDLFAGTGVLGFEALSRGARRAVLVERDRDLAAALEEQKARLGAEGAEIVWADALAWLRASDEPFDIIFLDPPYALDLAAQCCTEIADGKHLAPAGVVYVEGGGPAVPPAGFRIRKQARAGQVRYMLLELPA